MTRKIIKSFFTIQLLFVALFPVNQLFAGNDTIPTPSTNLPGINFFERVYNNPGTAFFRPDAFSNGDMGISYDYIDRENLHILQDGEGLSQYTLFANGLTVKDNKMFWGKVAYRNFRQDNVQWNNNYDYSRVGPYLIADSIGGDVRGEEYHISGGLSIQHNKWLFGGQAAYTAGQNYRKIDPRPKATSSDLSLQLSASYNLVKNYQVGLSGQVGRYKEDLNINVIREGAKYYFFSVKGFGMKNPKISEETSYFSSYYEGLNYEASAFLVPTGKNGLIANFKFRYEYIDFSKGSNTTSKPFTYRTYKSENEIGWQRNTSTQRTFIRLYYDYVLGKGTERIYYYQKVNDIFGQDFLLATYKFYTRKNTDYGLSGYQEWISPRNTKWVQLNAGINEYEERYAYPVYKMNFKKLNTALSLGGEFPLKGASALIPSLRFAYSHNLSSTKYLPEESPVFDLSIAPNIPLMEADIYSIGAGLQYQYKLKNDLKLYASAKGNYISDKHENQYTMLFAIGVKY